MQTLPKDKWLGVIIGFDNGLNIKGIMRYDGTEGNVTQLVRMDGRVLAFPVTKSSMFMYDILVDYIEGDTEQDVLNEPIVRDWLKDNTSQRGDK